MAGERGGVEKGGDRLLRGGGGGGAGQQVTVSTWAGERHIVLGGKGCVC